MKITNSEKNDILLNIKEEISEEELDSRLKKESEHGRLEGGEQCFRKDYPWYRLNIGYTNPLNFGEVHAELELIKKHIRESNSDKILTAIKGNHLVFYGIGVGDTEIAFVDWVVKKGQKVTYLTGIDVNKDFLSNFVVALKNRTFEPDEPTFFFQPKNTLFEKLLRENLKVRNLKNVHICLGGTIGNFYNQEKLFELFSNLSENGEYLILGFQLDNNLNWIFKKYESNPLFPSFVLNYLPPEKRKLKWSVKEETGMITAVHNSVEVFRTTKYNSERLKKLVEKHGFKFVYEDVDEYKNSCLHVYLKI